MTSGGRVLERRERLRIGACLCLTGKYSKFGVQAARGLEAWAALDGGVDLTIEDDESDPTRIEPGLRRLAQTSHLLLGPYSTQLMRAAARVVPGTDHLIWNHGGSGDDVEVAVPGRIVSVLAPTSRYAEPFLRQLAAERARAPVWIAEGKGSFGRQVAAGAMGSARRLGLEAARVGPGQTLLSRGVPDLWDLFCAGMFEDDISRIEEAHRLSRQPRHICAIAAGVRDFASVVSHSEGIFGVAQWFPDSGVAAEIGPDEPTFLAAYASLSGTSPDYPAVQAAAAGVLAAHCARVAGRLNPPDLWSVAIGLDTSTLFGGFKVHPITGAQVKHHLQLVRWTAGEPVLITA